MTADELREEIELQIVQLLKEKLESGEITEERAAQISDQVLTILVPGMTLEELYKAVPALDDRMTELAPIVLPFVRDYEKNVTGQALENVRELIKQGQYDAAAKLGKKVAATDVELTWTGSGKSDNK
jgi:hypothetical protein